MNAWSAWTEPFDVPTGPLDMYQSLQRLAPQSCVAAHCHDGPENGFVVDGIVTRWEGNACARQFVAGTSFVTPAAVVHATGNASAAIAEQITLHVLPRGAPFAHPCTCVESPPAAPGSTSRARVRFAIDSSSTRVRTRHAMLGVNDLLSIPASNDAMLLTVVEGDLAIMGKHVKASEGSHITGRSAEVLVRGSGLVIMTELRSST